MHFSITSCGHQGLDGIKDNRLIAVVSTKLAYLVRRGYAAEISTVSRYENGDRGASPATLYRRGQTSEDNVKNLQVYSISPALHCLRQAFFSL